jgi:hypothetical protein
MGLIDHEEDGFACRFFGLQESALDLGVDGAFGQPWSEAEEAIDVVEQIGSAEGGKWSIEGLEEILIEAVYEVSEGEGFAHSRVSGEQQDAPSSFDIVQSRDAFFEGVGGEGILGLDVFIKREVFESEPGEEIFHGRTLPL